MSDDEKVLPPEKSDAPGPGAPAAPAVGVDHPRMETTEKLTGDALYTGDLLLPGMLHAKVKRSPHARARIQPRWAVRSDSPRASAVSASLSPPK